MQISTVAWTFGAVWLAATTGAPLTLFAQELRATPFEFGLLAAMPYLAALLSIPSCLLIECTGRRKRIFLWGLYLQRALWFPLAVVPLWIVLRFGAAATGEALSVFLALTLVMHCGQGIGGPAWTSWMADLVPQPVHGKYFSRRRQWGIVTSLPAALLIGWILDRGTVWYCSRPMLGGCALIFCAAALFGLADISLFQLVPEPPMRAQSGFALLRALGKPLRDRQFMRISGFVSLLTFALTLTNQFQALFLMNVVKVGNTRIQIMLLVAPMLAQLLVLPLWGAAADRMGKRPLFLLSALALVPLSVGWCLMRGGQAWLGYLLSGATAALWAGVEVANLNLVLQTSGASTERDGGSAFAAINCLLTNLAGLAGGLAAGLVAQFFEHWSWQPIPTYRAFTGYDLLFAASGLLRLAAVVVFWGLIVEPQAQSVGRTTRFILGSVIPKPLFRRSGTWARIHCPLGAVNSPIHPSPSAHGVCSRAEAA